jgi:hypothetical protein
MHWFKDDASPATPEGEVTRTPGEDGDLDAYIILAIRTGARLLLSAHRPPYPAHSSLGK